MRWDKRNLTPTHLFTKLRASVKWAVRSSDRNYSKGEVHHILSFKQVIKIVISSSIGHKMTYGDKSDWWKVNLLIQLADTKAVWLGSVIFYEIFVTGRNLFNG